MFKTFLCYLFFIIPLFAEPRVKVQSIGLSDYPNVEIQIHSETKPNPSDLSIREQVGVSSMVVSEFVVEENTGKNPVDLYLSLPSYTDATDRRWLLALASRIFGSTEGTGGISNLHIQSNAKFIQYERIQLNSISNAFPYPKEPLASSPIQSLEEFLDSIPESKKDKILIFVNFQSEWADRFRIPEFAKKIREKKIHLIVISPSSLAATKLVSYTDGEFYEVSKNESYANLFTSLQKKTRPSFTIKYKSPWDISKLETETVALLIGGFGLNNDINIKYELSMWWTLYRKFSDPFLFFPAVLFLVLLCFASLYYLRGFDGQKETYVATMEKVSPESRDEIEVYDRVYGETMERAARDKEIANSIREKEVPEGLSYSYAVLIKKENGNEKYPIQWDETKLGRSETNHLVLFDSEVSNLHAKIKKVKGKFILFDCASETGVYLNGRKLLRPKVLFDLDEIRLGKTVLSFRGR
ncbi:FHA domain-containing protein [Leptospira sp. 96542]|nr:FHA domain-containing protein [Leptospira sp. 96542]